MIIAEILLYVIQRHIMWLSRRLFSLKIIKQAIEFYLKPIKFFLIMGMNLRTVFR